MIISSEEIRQNIEEIRMTIEKAAQRAGRSAQDVQLMAVTKTKPEETVRALMEAGQTLFGENYPDEIKEKAELYANSGVTMAMIGHLQSRKAKIVADCCSAWHSLDRLETAEKMEQLCAERNRILPVLIECNVGDEDSKSGWHFADDSIPDEFLKDFETVQKLEHLKVQGLMILPPFTDDAEINRKYFIRTRRIAEYLNAHCGGNLHTLSMGTSNDYPVAIEEGATIVRIGTALVGAREYKNR